MAYQFVLCPRADTLENPELSNVQLNTYIEEFANQLREWPALKVFNAKETVDIIVDYDYSTTPFKISFTIPCLNYPHDAIKEGKDPALVEMREIMEKIKLGSLYYIESSCYTPSKAKQIISINNSVEEKGVGYDPLFFNNIKPNIFIVSKEPKNVAIKRLF